MKARDLMLTHILGCQWIDLFTHPPVLSQEKEQHFKNMCRRFDNGEPLQYILGECDFMGIPLKINPSVLIPRPETEILVERVLEIVQLNPKSDKWEILDLGTGSGNIAIALAKLLSNSHISAVEISNTAIALARGNALDNGVSDKISFINADMREVLQWGKEQLGCFDIITSNPPYIRTSDLNSLPRDVQQEPKIALDGGNDGLDFYRILIDRGHYYLKQDGYIFMEIGDGQGRNIQDIANEQLYYNEICFYPDYTQTQRIISLRRKLTHG